MERFSDNWFYNDRFRQQTPLPCFISGKKCLQQRYPELCFWPYTLDSSDNRDIRVSFDSGACCVRNYRIARRSKCTYRGSGPLHRAVTTMMHDVNGLEQELMAVNFHIQELDRKPRNQGAQGKLKKLFVRRDQILDELNKLYSVFGHTRIYRAHPGI